MRMHQITKLYNLQQNVVQNLGPERRGSPHIGQERHASPHIRH